MFDPNAGYFSASCSTVQGENLVTRREVATGGRATPDACLMCRPPACLTVAAVEHCRRSSGSPVQLRATTGAAEGRGQPPAKGGKQDGRSPCPSTALLMMGATRCRSHGGHPQLLETDGRCVSGGVQAGSDAFGEFGERGQGTVYPNPPQGPSWDDTAFPEDVAVRAHVPRSHRTAQRSAPHQSRTPVAAKSAMRSVSYPRISLRINQLCSPSVGPAR